MIKRAAVTIVFACLSVISSFTTMYAQSFNVDAPRVLIVVAHPDDEAAFAATVYKITHELHGVVEQALITDGEGGYKYSTLAEPIYHLKLTDEKVGRKYLPGIRKKELENAGKIIGVTKWYYFNQKDHHYTMNPHEALDTVWNVPFVSKHLHDILMKGHYDFVFTLLPTDSTHGHHKDATILALQAINALPKNVTHPIALGITLGEKNKPSDVHYSMLKDFPITSDKVGHSEFSLDRTQSFGYKNKLNYKVIVNWEIAEHKSQGTEQLGMNYGDTEDYWYYDINDPAGRTKTKQLFDRLAEITKTMYPPVFYPGEER